MTVCPRAKLTFFSSLKDNASQKLHKLEQKYWDCNNLIFFFFTQRIFLFSTLFPESVLIRTDKQWEGALKHSATPTIMKEILLFSHYYLETRTIRDNGVPVNRISYVTEMLLAEE